MRKINGYHLYLGNLSDARNAASLSAADIGAVVDLALNEAPAALPRELVHCRYPHLLWRRDEPHSGNCGCWIDSCDWANAG
jgi:hypothetical protein